MLSQKEIEFVNHWKSVRVEHSSFSSKMKRGLPMAILFSMPIIFSIAAVYFFSPEWYTKVSQKASSSFTPIFIAVFICILFILYVILCHVMLFYVILCYVILILL